MTSITEISSLLTEFFISNGFEEVKTPEVIPAPVPEPYIDLFRVDGGYKRPSPEVEMKIHLSEHGKSIFQIGKCFRKEEVGRHHKEEFTMLEWYEVEADYNDTLRLTQKLLLFLAEKIHQSSTIIFNNHTIHLDREWSIFTVEEAFLKFANIALEEAIAEDKFEEILVKQVEPALLECSTPAVLKDYPAKFAALAKLSASNPAVAERWELYIGGVELANTYSELTDPDGNRKRFAQFADERRELGKKELPVNEAFFNALEKGMPRSSGCAIGVERLAMIVNNHNDIALEKEKWDES